MRSLGPVALLAWAILAGCAPDGEPPAAASLTPGSTSTAPSPPATATPNPTPTAAAPLPSPIPANRLESSCQQDVSLLSNGAFDSGLTPWTTRSGELRFARTTYAGTPGAALLVTSLTTADGGKVAVAGQCVDLAEVPGLARAEIPGQSIDIDAYLLALPETESVSLFVVYHSGAGCSGEVIAVDGPPGVAGGAGWTRVTQAIPVPPGTAAIDFVVRAIGPSGAGRALVDAVCAYPSPMSD